jgi:hypothetical protein
MSKLGTVKRSPGSSQILPVISLESAMLIIDSIVMYMNAGIYTYSYLDILYVLKYVYFLYIYIWYITYIYRYSYMHKYTCS